MVYKVRVRFAANVEVKARVRVRVMPTATVEVKARFKVEVMPIATVKVKSRVKYMLGLNFIWVEVFLLESESQS